MRAESDERVLVTTLTKKMSEDLTDYLLELGIRVRYLHSEVDTLRRVELLRELRMGEFDVLVGINLLREGLDLPEVSLVSILDADKEGFLRSGTSLIQTIGRAARNVSGQVHMYADKITPSMAKAIDETNRRRAKQVAYNLERGVDPQPLRKKIADILDQISPARTPTPSELIGGSGRQQSRGKAPVPGLSSPASTQGATESHAAALVGHAARPTWPTSSSSSPTRCTTRPRELQFELAGPAARRDQRAQEGAPRHDRRGALAAGVVPAWARVHSDSHPFSAPSQSASQATQPGCTGRLPSRQAGHTARFGTGPLTAHPVGSGPRVL